MPAKMIKKIPQFVKALFSKKKLMDAHNYAFLNCFEQEDYAGANDILAQARAAHLDVAQMLNSSGHSVPSQYAVGVAQNVFMRVRNVDMLKYLLDNGADPTFKDRDAQNGIFYHLLRNPECIAYLIEKDIDTLIENKYPQADRDVLSLLICSYTLIDSNPQIHNIRAILDKNPEKLEIIYSSGETPLLQACEQGHPEVVRIFLERGANPHFGVWTEAFEEQDKRVEVRETPMTVAAYKENREVVDLLLSFHPTLKDIDLFLSEIENSDYDIKPEFIEQINIMKDRLILVDSLSTAISVQPNNKKNKPKSLNKI